MCSRPDHTCTVLAVVADTKVKVTWAVAAVAAVVTVGVCCLAFGAVVRTVVVVAGDLCLL